MTDSFQKLSIRRWSKFKSHHVAMLLCDLFYSQLMENFEIQSVIWQTLYFLEVEACLRVVWELHFVSCCCSVMKVEDICLHMTVNEATYWRNETFNCIRIRMQIQWIQEKSTMMGIRLAYPHHGGIFLYSQTKLVWHWFILWPNTYKCFNNLLFTYNLWRKNKTNSKAKVFVTDKNYSCIAVTG